MDDDLPRRPRSRRSRYAEMEYDDDDDDEGGTDRIDATQMVAAMAKSQGAAQTQAARGQADMMTIMLMQQQEAARARAEEDRRREEREEARRRDDDQRRRDEENRRREEDQKREDRRREEDREERRAAEKREDERRAQHLEEVRRAEAATQTRMQLLLGGITALAPLISKVFEKKDDPVMAAILGRVLAKPEPDQMQLMMFKSIMDKMANDGGSSNLIQQMGEMQKLAMTMNSEQMRSMLQTTNEFQQQMMKKAIEVAMAGPGNEEKKPFLESLMGALGSAAEIVKTLAPASVPSLPATQPAAAPAARHPARRALPPPPAEQPAPGAPAAASADTTAPAEQGQQETTIPPGIPSVLFGLMALQQGRTQSTEEVNHVRGYIAQNMPPEMRVAVRNGDQAALFSMCQPVIAYFPALQAWATPAIIPWLGAELPNVIPYIDAVEQQEAALAQGAAAGAQPAPDEGLAIDPNGQGQVIPGPGSEQRQQVEVEIVAPATDGAPADAAPVANASATDGAPAAPTSTGSHLDP